MVLAILFSRLVEHSGWSAGRSITSVITSPFALTVPPWWWYSSFRYSGRLSPHSASQRRMHSVARFLSRLLCFPLEVQDLPPPPPTQEDFKQDRQGCLHPHNSLSHSSFGCYISSFHRRHMLLGQEKVSLLSESHQIYQWVLPHAGPCLFCLHMVNMHNPGVLPQTNQNETESLCKSLAHPGSSCG